MRNKPEAQGAAGKAGRRARDPADAGPVACETAAELGDAAAQLAGRADLSGSGDGRLTLLLLNQAWRALWRGDAPCPPGLPGLQHDAVKATREGIAPRDPLEGMLAVQLLATHEAAMGCFHRAHAPGRTHEARQADLAQANKLVRSYAALLEALDRHRGKGRQVVRVEHVTVNAGGRAIVGAVSHAGGGGSGTEREERPHAPCLAHEPGAAVRGQDAGREPVPVAGGEGEEPLPDARRRGR